MKVFISWSGELSNAVAQVLKKYLPCIIQNADVFCSSEDIEKGENWDGRLTSELASSCFGIICLTPSNKNAAWINFEAGAIAKTLESRLSALMINLRPSDIQGPLKRYQATNLEENDIKKLINDINKASNDPRDTTILNESFEAFWPKIDIAIKDAIKMFSKGQDAKKETEKSSNEAAIEEILQLVRKQSVMLSNQERLISKEVLNSSQISIPQLEETVNKARSILMHAAEYTNLVYKDEELSEKLVRTLLIIQNDIRTACQILYQISTDKSEYLLNDQLNVLNRKKFKVPATDYIVDQKFLHKSLLDVEADEEQQKE